MTTTDREPFHREDDDELVGLLAPAGDGLVIPMTVFGAPLTGPREPDEARAILLDHGLASLADPWYARIDGVDEPVRVLIMEAAVGRVRVRQSDLGMDGAIGGEVMPEWTFTGADVERLTPARPVRR